jgi:peptide subunit release factor 1 (eRF1)
MMSATLLYAEIIAPIISSQNKYRHSLPYCIISQRLSVLGAITSTQQKLKLYNRIPENGLVLYCGIILTDDGKEKRVNIDFEPFKPINTSLYLCDNKFHTEVSYIDSK